MFDSFGVPDRSMGSTAGMMVALRAAIVCCLSIDYGRRLTLFKEEEKSIEKIKCKKN